ncbi:unnamed protein product (macronuclear) [Paramecium tetraurelia]|uniref:TNFR-Cys domain-containing protein n=1 Tax=Paramecium tetraurelia TaxID=5888 RepID=A0C050_PARTE|nr:uncharacterized protein GSPATT00006020001 [Paramecium tetraurelia]CAK64167.1 unnamed protein product [Paramecium tetraurelia]|eukprot:XP_001431565.1 hypothetical protein (macronuclear) [Paramecium tetraurelia strain d4-2]
MLFIFHLLQICISSFSYINDQTRYSVDSEWDNPFYSYGVVSKLCPLGAKYYMYESMNTDIYYFLSSAKLLEGGLFYLHYVELSNSREKIIHHLYYYQENQWLSNEFIFNLEEYEGLWYQQYINYDVNSKLLNLEMRWGDHKKSLKSYSFQEFKYSNINFVIGGSYQVLCHYQLQVVHPITKYMLNLKTFPGQLLAAVSVYERDREDAWDIFSEIKCSDNTVLLLGQLDMKEFNQHQIYMIENQNQKYYKVTFWAKIQNDFDPEVDHKIHVLRIVANRFTTDFQATGSNSFILSYMYYSEQKQWMIRIQYYSYVLPIIVQFTNNNDPFQKEDLIFVQNHSLLSTWHFIQVEYDPDTLNFHLINKKQDKKIEKRYTNVNQFSNIYYRLFFGGSREDFSTLGRSFGLILFYDCNNENIQCHYSCQTCIGPSQNQCLSCPEQKNRIYNEVEQTCRCKVWYSEKSDFTCQFVTQNQVTVSLIDEQEEQDQEFCKFGEFSFDQMCFQCPSASQHNQVICAECLMRPIDWVLKSTNCKNTYYLFESSNNFLKKRNDPEITNIQFLFENEQLIPCKGCLLCNQFQDQDCYLSNYKHLNQQTYIKCIDNYMFENGECFQIRVLKIKNTACQNNCKYCNEELCYVCSSQTQYFINSKGQCQQCSILHCKYCFQYNQYNIKENSILNDAQNEGQVNDDYVIGCALCQQGYSFSFKTNLCIKNKIDNNCLYYIDSDGDTICYATQFELLENKFQQITNCQDKIPNCEQCIYNLFDLMVCLQCKVGYYNNNLNGLCISCNEKFENVQECELNNKMLQRYKLETIGYLQQLTQDFYGLSQLFRNYDQVLITQCSNNLVLDIQSNKCISPCSNCDICEQIDGEQQCLKCTTTSDEYIDFYSQISGRCYQCPYPCRFCLPLDSDLVHKYNPYFLLNSTSIKQTHKCLLNFNNNLTYIDQRSGLIQPYNNETKLKQKFISNSQQKSSSIFDGNFILQKSISNYYYIIENMIPHQENLLNDYYALKNYTATIIVEADMTGQGFVELFNITNFHIFNSLYKLKGSHIAVTTVYGVDVIVQNLTIRNEIAKNFLTINFSSDFQISVLSVKNVYLYESTIITINNFVKNASIQMNDLQFKNCTFQDSQFFYFASDKFNKILIKSVKIQNCTFRNSLFINQLLQNRNQQYVIEEFLIEDSFLDNSSIFFISKSQDMVLIRSVKLLNTFLNNSTIISTFSSVNLETVQIVDTIAIKSRIFYHQFESTQTFFLVNQLQCQNLQLNGTNILQLISLTQNINIDVIIKYSKFEKIDQIYSKGKISDNFFFYIQSATYMQIISQSKMM